MPGGQGKAGGVIGPPIGSGPPGNDIRSMRWGRHGTVERIVFEVYEEWQGETPLSQPRSFEVDSETHPHRLIVRLEGVWSVSAAVPSLKKSSLVGGIYRIPSRDRSGQLFAITLKKPATYKVFSLGDPARIVIDVTEQKRGSSAKAMYSLRTVSYRETTYRLWETLTSIRTVLSTATGGEAHIIQSRDGAYFVEEGLYVTREEAEGQKKALMKEGYRLHVEKRGPGDIPEALF